MTEFIHKVTADDKDLQVKDLLRRRFDFSSRLRNKIKREKLLTLNGEPVEGWITPAEGDIIKIALPDEHSNFEPQDIPVFPVFEDDDLLILNKQPGLIVHPTKGHPNGTMANALMNYMQKTGRPFKIRFVNRLDMDTSGLLVVAKNAYCQNEYTRQMKENIVEKRYIAIVDGLIKDDEGTVDLPIGRPDPDDVRRAVVADGYPSLTHFKVLERYTGRKCTLVELLLMTGRTHQIRVHMSHIGHPVLGDSLYGTSCDDIIRRQALHAASLSFIHPIKKEQLHVTAPLPDDMKNAVAKLTDRP